MYRIHPMEKKQRRKFVPSYFTFLFCVATGTSFIMMLLSSIQLTQRYINTSIDADVVSMLNIGNNTLSEGRTKTSKSIIELKYRECPAWNHDHVWRYAIVRPELCSSALPDGPTNGNFNLSEQKLQLSLLNDTLLLRNISRNVDVSPTCGSYCVFHPSSLYSHQFDIPIFGWQLRKLKPNDSGTTSATGCWQPFNSHTNDIDLECIEYSYNHWLNRIEDMLPQEQTEQAHSVGKISNTLYPMFYPNASDTKGYKLPLIQIQEFIKTPVCNDINNIYQRIKRHFVGRKTTSVSLVRPTFCHHRTYRHGSKPILPLEGRKPDKSIRSRIHQNDKTLLPSEVVLHLFEQTDLGINDLSYSLAFLMTETFNKPLCNSYMINTLQGNQPSSLLCVYHRHSIPRLATVPGQYGSKVPIKGWQYQTQDQCFIPIKDMEKSATCGRFSDQFHAWTQHMADKKVNYIETVRQNSDSTFSKCDRLPLLLGQNTWDEESNKYVFLPPLPKTAATSSDNGAQRYSEASICGPRVLIAGAMKCGTNTIGKLLSYHPRVTFNRCRTSEKPNCDGDHFVAESGGLWEDHSLTVRYVTDRFNYVGKYAQRLPLTEEYDYLKCMNGSSKVNHGSFTFDKSPSYMDTEKYPNVAKRAKTLVPNAKVIFSLCDPTERMYSEYHHNMKNDYKNVVADWKKWNVSLPQNFTEFVNQLKFSNKQCQTHPTFCYELRRNSLRTGLYHKHILAWRNVFGAENVLVLDMTESDLDKMKKIIALMGDYLPNHEYPWEMLGNISTIVYSNTLYRGRSSGYIEHSQAFDWLQGYFFQHNIALADEIHAEWPLLWNVKRGKYSKGKRIF